MLGKDARDFVVKRALFYRNIKNQTLVAELLTAMASELGDKRLIVDVLGGRNQRGIEAVRIIVKDFKKSGMQSIGDYYRCSYPGKAEQILLGAGQQQVEEPKQVQPRAEEPKQVTFQVKIQPTVAQDRPADVEDLIAPRQPKPSADDRLSYVASCVAKWTKVPVERALKMDRDLIDRLIAFADANADKATVSDVCRACESMLRDRALNIQFPLEILTMHKDELLKRSLSPGK
jgi:hypothetical protein